jgi:AraC family transcriptional regulator
MLILDFTQENSVSQILPHPPIFSSDRLRWESIYAQYHRQPAWTVPKFSSSLHIILVNQSDRRILFDRVLNGDRQKSQLDRGEMVIFPANVCSQASWDCEMDFTLLFLEPTYLDRIARQFSTSEAIDNITLEPCFGICDRAIETIASLFKQELESEQVSSDFHVDALRELLCLTLLRQYSTRKDREIPQKDLHSAIAYINENLAENLSLKNVARVAKISSYYFARLFKISTGMTLNQYVTNRRIEKAKQILSHQNLSVVEVAKLVGIESQSHFNRVFLQHTGSTPKAYRNK